MAVRSAPSSSAPAPMLVPVGQHQGQQPLPLNRLFTLIGSAPNARLYLPSTSVSRAHAVIINTDGNLYVRDLASRNQVRINGRPTKEADLREGDVLQVGSFTFRFTDPTAAGKPRPPVPPLPRAELEVEGLDEPLPLEDRALLIGRRETADISLTENAASSAHALLFVAEGKHIVRDLNSRTGTFVNGVKVHEHALASGDVLRVGETIFRYLRSGAGASTTPAAAPEPAPQAPPPHSARDETEAPATPRAADGGSGDDLDLIPLEPAPPESQVGLVPSSQAALDAEAPADDPAAAALGLLEMGESFRDAELSPPEALSGSRSSPAVHPDAHKDNNGEAHGHGEPAPDLVPDATSDDAPGKDLDLELEPLLPPQAPAAKSPPPAARAQPAPPPPPAPPNALGDAEPAVRRPSRWSKAAGKSDKSAPPRPARPANPFDVLGQADDLEPLPELPSSPPPAPEGAPMPSDPPRPEPRRTGDTA